MSNKSRVQRLQAAAQRSAPFNRRTAPLPADERAALRKDAIAAGLRPVNHFTEFSDEELQKFCEFHGIDPTREEYDLPCSSWPLEDHMIQISYWHGKVGRGEMRREEYHRLVLELAGLPPPEASSSSGS